MVGQRPALLGEECQGQHQRRLRPNLESTLRYLESSLLALHDILIGA